MSKTFRLEKQSRPVAREYDGEEPLEVTDMLAIEVHAGGKDDDEELPWYPTITVEKYRSQEDFEAGKRYEKVERRGNILTDLGGNRVISLFAGAGGTAFDAANGKIAVGDSSTAASVGQTALQGTNTLAHALDGGYPTISGRTLTARASFAAGEANFEWREWGLMIGSMLVNRKTGTFGIKLSGAIWVATATVTD